MDNLSFFSIIFIGFLVLRGFPPSLIPFFTRFWREFQGSNKEIRDTPIKVFVEEKKEIKYEDKYLSSIRCLAKDFDFSLDELRLQEELETKFYNEYKEQFSKQTEDSKAVVDVDKQVGIIRERAKQSANKEIVNTKLKRLENCHVMETTPLGNVLMIYDLNKESF
jgi:hypothetical protein